ncbi:VF530 family DNA-binding protein [Shewanella eurypsychrophilus]|uniref:VF530 family DNA-binding protein n=1 Tax=Shewanella eurypsychrophilus TaxID=2593656 RepID=A0ABX6V9J3_9GAMM|nr:MULTISPECIES: VF530 family DNA-binding protein [Shewanella]QFU24138.1 DNA-binding protein VF530 [Shewanella sp. YLB-09]QPG59345.1 VF530 family DNA-binding protein [Shewanella eurypsychrophilus]
MIEQQQNNPLHGLGLETMVTELVAFYDWKILYASLRLECFNSNPNMAACLKFLKKTEWARERVESFYLYRFKRMPKGDSAQFELKPRERGFADGIVPRKPEELTVELVDEMRVKATADYEEMKRNKDQGKPRYAKDKPRTQDGYAQNKGANANRPAPSQDPNNPWGK